MIRTLLSLALVATPVAASTYTLQPKQVAIAEFAACAVGQDREGARKVFATAPGSAEEHAALMGLAKKLDRCAKYRAFVSGKEGQFRGALAEALIAAEPPRAERLRKLTAKAPVRAPLAGGRQFLTGYARCIAEARPADSLALMATPLGTPSEQQAVMAMGETLSACMPEGAQYRLDVRDLRNHVADALFQISEVAGA